MVASPETRAATAAVRIRSRAVWSIALFAAYVPVALLTGPGEDSGSDRQAVTSLLATLFWGSGAIMALLAGFGCMIYRSILPRSTILLGSAPIVASVCIGGLQLLLIILAH